MATETTAPVPPTPNGNTFVGLLVHWGPTLVFNLAGPLLVYSYLVDHGSSKSAAIMISSLLPLVELAAIYALTRRIDDFGIFTLFTYAEFRHVNRVITIIWGTGLCLESAIRIILIGVLSVKTMVGLPNVLIYTMVGLILALTIWYGRRRQSQADQTYGDDASSES
jgi:prepilin signal peptidase PulO-like enzyme (type II secretory pathway)